MAVTNKAVDKVEASPEKKIDVELWAHERFVGDVFGTGLALYQRGLRYSVTREQADAFLAFRSEGQCPFRVYRAPKAKSQPGDEVEVSSLPRSVTKPGKKSDTGAEIPTVKGDKMSLTTSEEEKELFGEGSEKSGVAEI
jgi:hypothetical protein